MVSRTELDTTDAQWMRRALTLAARGAGRTSPNPMVGAVVVKDGRAVAEGWHEGPGLPHAERIALDRAGEAARGATLYVTLEPCSHHGRTPPCVERVIASGVRRVVAAMQDPNPKVKGAGFKRLHEAGITVEVGLLAQEAERLNRGYLTWVTRGRPFVTLKLAQSLDGRAATATRESQWITSEEARLDAHRLRAEVDAILCGIGTVLADDPLLTARPDGAPAARQPARVILDSLARLPEEARCLREPGGPTWVATTSGAPRERCEALLAAGARVWTGPQSDGRVDLAALLQALAEAGITWVLVEGGPTVAGAFADRGLVDEIVAYIAPMVIGGDGAPGSVGGAGASRLAHALRLAEWTWSPVGADLKVTGRVRSPADVAGLKEEV